MSVSITYKTLAPPGGLWYEAPTSAKHVDG